MIDVTQHLLATSRTVGSRTIEAGEARAVTISQTYDADLDDVWDACTNPERIPRWFLPVIGDLRLGGRFQLEGNAGGTILECDPPHGFRATWECGDMANWITLRLNPAAGGGTRLELEHLVPVDAHWAEFGPGAVGLGWDLGLVGLATHLATGAAVAGGEGQAWAASPDGLRFTTAGGEGWYQADVASGTEAAVARAAADRTLAAYTGADPAASASTEG